MRHSAFTAVYDACVLYPAPLRDFLMWLALSGRFRAKWSMEIHNEWKRNLLKNRPDLTIEQLNRTSELMDVAVPDACVTGYEELIAGLTLPDADDRHVLAAAIRCDASVIVTFNRKDFPCSALGVYDIEAQHRDEFVSNLFDLDPAGSGLCGSTPTKTAEGAAHGYQHLPRPYVSTRFGSVSQSAERLPNDALRRDTEATTTHTHQTRH